jgi:hypothetical protein
MFRKSMKNQRGSVFLEMIPSFIIFFMVASFIINFFIYAYTSTLLSLAAQEAGRETIYCLSTVAHEEGRAKIRISSLHYGEIAGKRYLENFGVGSLIKSPTINVVIKKDAISRDSVIEATASGTTNYAFLGSQFFTEDGVNSKTVTYYLEYSMQ